MHTAIKASSFLLDDCIVVEHCQKRVTEFISKNNFHSFLQQQKMYFERKANTGVVGERRVVSPSP